MDMATAFDSTDNAYGQGRPFHGRREVIKALPPEEPARYSGISPKKCRLHVAGSSLATILLMSPND